MMHNHMPDSLLHALASGAGIQGLRILGRIERPGSQVWRGRGEIQGRPRDLVVKVLRSLRPEDEAACPRRERVGREFEALRTLHRALAPWPDLSVPEPVACLPEHLALVLEARRGETLSSLILRRARSFSRRSDWEDITRGFRAAGNWLARVQDLSRERRDCLNPDDLAAYNEVRLRRLAAMGCLSRALAARVREETERLCRAIREGHERAVTLAHGDFCPGNILLDGGTVVVLDFTMVGRGSVLEDLTYCYEHIERFLSRSVDRPLFRRPVIRRLQNALLEGYRPGMDIASPLFRLNQMRHHLNYLVNLHEPTRGLRRIVRRLDVLRGLWGLEAWLQGRGVSPAGARP